MMSLTPDEARTALHDISKTENRTAASQHARQGAPHLILWGLIWAVGYSASALRPDIELVWPVLIATGVVGGFFLGWRNAKAGDRGDGWRYGASLGAIAAFIFGLYTIMPPGTTIQGGAFFPLLVGLCYCLMGIWSKGWRMLPLGLAIIVLTVGAYLFVPQYFLLVMAVVGGGGLILGGLWLRSV